MKKFLLAFGLVFGLSASAFAAPFTNGGFEGGLAPWSGTGTFSVGGTFAGQVPAGGAAHAIIQTEPGSSTMATLATTLGTTVGSINGLGVTGTEGSGIAQSWITGLGANATIGFGIINVSDTLVNSALLVDNVSVSDDGTLSFTFNFLTDELNQAAAFNDTAFLVVNGAVIFLENKNTGPFPVGPGGGFDGGTGPQVFSQQFAALANPEPASMLAWGLIVGVGAVGYRLRKRGKVVA